MDLRVLRYFLTVVREENITKAAEILHITQPTLSRQLQELEKHLGIKLFRRGKNRITLTEDGVLLRRRAEELIDLADKTELEFRKQDENISGIVSIGSGESISVQILASFMKDFSKKYPDIYFELYTGNADNIKERLDRGVLDIGLLIEPVEIDKYDYIRLPEKEKTGILMRADSELAGKEFISVSDIKSLSLIIPKRISFQNEFANWVGDDWNTINIYATCNLIGNAIRLVKQGIGMAITVEGAVDMYHNDELVFKPLYPDVSSTSVFVWKKYQPFGKAASKFIEELKYALKA